MKIDQLELARRLAQQRQKLVNDLAIITGAEFVSTIITSKTGEKWTENLMDLDTPATVAKDTLFCAFVDVARLYLDKELRRVDAELLEIGVEI